MLRHDREGVLKGVSCEIEAGTFCAILGPSGGNFAVRVPQSG
jgi:ABC-type lipoprotein export system ATPase subunit